MSYLTLKAVLLMNDWLQDSKWDGCVRQNKFAWEALMAVWKSVMNHAHDFG